MVLACSSTCGKKNDENKIKSQKHPVTNDAACGPWCGRLYRFFHLDLVDFDAEKLVFEVVVAGKLVSIFYVLALWNFSEHACLPTGERLESPAQLAVLCRTKDTVQSAAAA